MTRLVVLLDDGGVLNDNAVRGQQWQRLVAEFFVPIFGGLPEAWVEANGIVAARIFEPVAWNALLAAARDYPSFERMYYATWLGGMCELLGLARPSDERCFELGIAAEGYIVPRIRAAMPGAIEAIRALQADGYELHTASGASSTMLTGYLETMGLRDCFGRLYGPDLIGVFKDGPAFYERLFADLGLPPQHALVVDDNAMVLGWAAQMGAHTLLVGGRGDAGAVRQISSMAELPAMVRQIGEP